MSGNPYSSGRWSRKASLSSDIIVGNVNRFTKGKLVQCEEMVSHSTIPIPAEPTDQAEVFLETLYEPDDEVNIVSGCSKKELEDGTVKASPIGSGYTRSARHQIRRIQGGQMPEGEAGVWLRMNPVKGVGTGKNGCYRDADIAKFIYGLLEFDDIPLEKQLALLGKIALPIVSITTSGGRSCHALVRVPCPDCDSYKRFFKRLLKNLRPLGIDPSNSNPSRMTRLPGATRKIGGNSDGRQRLLYLNPSPNPESKSIITQ